MSRFGGHGHQHRLQPLDHRRDVGRAEHRGVVLDTDGQFTTGLRLHRQRIVRGFVSRDIRDGQLGIARQRRGVHRVVLEREQRVEQLVLTGDAMNLVERQVLMVEGVVVATLQLVEQVRRGGRRGEVGADRHGVDEQADHRLDAGDFRGPPGHRGAEHHVVAAGQPAQQLRVRRLQHGVDGGVP